MGGFSFVPFGEYMPCFALKWGGREKVLLIQENFQKTTQNPDKTDT